MQAGKTARQALPFGVCRRQADSTSQHKRSDFAKGSSGCHPRAEDFSTRVREGGRLPPLQSGVLELRALWFGWSVGCARGSQCPGVAGARWGRVSSLATREPEFWSLKIRPRDGEGDTDSYLKALRPSHSLPLQGLLCYSGCSSPRSRAGPWKSWDIFCSHHKT